MRSLRSSNPTRLVRNLPARIPAPQPLTPTIPSRKPEARRTPLPELNAFNLGLLVTIVLLINHFARPFEHFLQGFRIPAVIVFSSLVLCLVSGSVRQFTSSTGIFLALFTVWMALISPLSSWRTGSVDYVRSYAEIGVVLVLLVAHTPRSTKDLSRLAYATGIGALLSLLIGSSEETGRLSSSVTYGNADDLGLMAGFALPLFALFAIHRKNSFLKYGSLFLGCGYLLLSVGRTATRAAMPALILMLAVYIWHSSMAQRFWIIAASAIMAVIMLLVLPQSTITRLSTIFDAFSSASIDQMARQSEAMASAAERRELLYDAIKMTTDNPLFGVGPGQYIVYRHDQLTYANGAKKLYFPSHNTYAQIAAEDGIPGILLYVSFLASIYFSTRRTRKLLATSTHPDTGSMRQLLTCTQAALVYFSACALFMTCDQHPHQFLVAGLAIGAERIVRAWASQPQPARPFAAPWATQRPAPVFPV